MSHYFLNDENLKNKEFEFEEKISDLVLNFKTNTGIFSKSKLDLGTKVLLEHFVPVFTYKKILDCGTGWGAISIFLAKKYHNFKIDAIDINQKALTYAKLNADINNVKINFFESNFFTNVKDKYDLIVSNPPIRIGKKNLFSFYQESIHYLNDNGVLELVVAKDKGAESSLKFLKQIYPTVSVYKKKKGYFLIRAVKNN